MSSYILLSILIGTAFIVAGLILVLVKGDDISPRAFWVVRVIVALGAGFVAAGILGNLEIGGKWEELTIKAGGPFAFTVLVYLVNPQTVVRRLVK